MKNKGIIAFCIVFCLFLSSCANNGRCDCDSVNAELRSAERTEVFIYKDNQGYEIDAKKISELLSGTWERASRPSEFNKILSVVVDTQYEICVFENGYAMIYSGYSDIFETDRQYYKIETAISADKICEYVRANGTEVEVKE